MAPRKKISLELKKNRKIIQNQLYHPTIIPIKKVYFSNKLIFNVDSWKNDGNSYSVSIENQNGIEFKCNCGHQFGISIRHSCKHIGNVLGMLVQTYVDHQIQEEEDQQLSQLLNKVLKINYKQVMRYKILQ